MSEPQGSAAPSREGARTPHSSAAADPLEAAQAWAVLLPVFLLTTPLLHGVPTAVSAGAGAAALASLPSVALLVLRKPRRTARALLLLLVPLLVCTIWIELAGPPFDSFGADRLRLVLTTAAAQAYAAASLGPRGRAVLARGATLAALLWLAGAAADTLLDPARSFAGVLENTGDLAAAALPGALVAALGQTRGPGLARVLCLVTLAGFIVYTAFVPVHSAALGFAGAALLGGLATSTGPAPAQVRARRRRAVLLGALILALGVAGARLLPHGATPIPAPSARPPAELGGVEFRLRTWARVDDVLLDHPWTGVGPGQFEASFPAYRDPKEIELSSFGRTAPYETQVEDAHNDWLEATLELGLPVGLCWIAFLLLTGLRGLGALRRGEEARAALGLGLAGLWIQAGASSVLLGAPASSALGFALAGAVLGPDAAPRPSASRRARWVPFLLGLLLLFQAPRAWALLAHGLALAPLSGAALVPIVDPRGHTVLGHESRRRADLLQRAQALAPDSPLVLAELADLARRTGEPLEQQEALWSRLLQHQPRRFEALLALGNLAARAGERERAAQWYEQAEQVDARHPALLVNRVQLALDAPIGEGFGQPELTAALDQLGAAEIEGLSERGARQLLAGRPIPAGMLLERVDPRLAVETGEEAYALARELEERDELLADGLTALAHQIWGREHAAAGRWDTAVRSYRQSLRVSRHHSPHEPFGAAAVRLELAAALVRSGRADQAQGELEGLVASPRHLRELPEWAGQALLEAGLLGR